MSGGLGSVRYFKDPDTNAWQRFEPWMTTIVDLDTGQVLGVVDGRDHTGVGAWLIQRPLEWRLGVHVVAIDPSAAFRKALRMWLPRTAVAVDHFHLVSLANQAVTEVRQQLSHQVHGRRGRAVDPAWAHRMLLLRAGDSLSDNARARMENVFATDDPTGKLKAAWDVKEQVRVLLRTGSLEEAELAKKRLEELVQESKQPETTRLWRTICRWWKEIEVHHRHRRHHWKSRSKQHQHQAHQTNCSWLPQPKQLHIGYSLEKCRPDGGMTLTRESKSPRTTKSHVWRLVELILEC
ncbi:ISL3 family transposase [Arthrobacter psychrolactophilus]